MTQQQSGRDKSAELRAMLIAHDVRSLRGSMGHFVLGVAWCLVVVFVWATVFTLVLDALFGGSGIGWRGWFVVAVLALVGLLAWMEMRAMASDTLLAQAADESGEEGEATAAGTAPLAEDYPMPISRGSPLYKLVWGPPAVLSGLRGLRGKRTRRQEAAFDRAVVLLFDLAQEPGRIEIKRLMHPPEDLATFATAVDWLEANDWIGRSTDGGSLWLSTLGQKRLVDAKLMGEGS